MSWQLASLAGARRSALAAGFAWYEREQPPARVLALVAALAALAVVGRLAFAAIPNVKPTTDIVLFAGYALGAVPGFVVGAIAALVSNIFLVQGPWTPWQMAAGAAVGVGGAAARPGRCAGASRAGCTLALVCGLAGLAFGAWMDVYQWTLAAHQDLDSYLALSATSLPYNLAHAIGNVVFCLLIGPAFIRALRRYRRRFEVRWPRARGRRRDAASLALLLVLPAAAGAAAPADRAERWLRQAPRTATAASARRPGQASSRALQRLGRRSAWRRPAATRATCTAAAGARSPPTSRATRARVKDIGEVERTVLAAARRGALARATSPAATWSPRDPRAAAAATARSPAT